ncbi:TetR family transcriptional regulator C-terminal domain-containing protein [Microbacteriaceae bacterium VKM Ac-2855]|nr:TetR family transcriptional regulator C-terminal domain-containing protein [Microbacteriaceae bacterium VKM Ac-2855]
MPKRVDHEARRGEIVDTLIRITARDGLQAATSRAIAAELGVATGALWHYFPSFDAVLAAAFVAAFDATNARITAATHELTGLAALRATMNEILPTAKVTQDEARVVVNFWGRVAVDENLIAPQAEFDEVWRERISAQLREAVGAGELRTGTPVDALTDVLLSISMGQQVEWVTRASLADAGRQTALVETVLSPWLA